MVRASRGLAAPLSALALLAFFAGRSDAQYYYAAPAPVVSYYYTPAVTYYTPRVSYYAPVTSYYAPAVSYYAPAVSYYAPVTSYYAPATYYSPGTATTYRYGLFGRRSVTYYTPPVYYGY